MLFQNNSSFSPLFRMLFRLKSKFPLNKISPFSFDAKFIIPSKLLFFVFFKYIYIKVESLVNKTSGGLISLINLTLVDAFDISLIFFWLKIVCGFMLKWFFKNKDYFPNTVVAKVLELLRIFNKTEPTFKMNINEVLLSYYPTKHYFIDYIIELFYDVRVNIIENISLITYPIDDRNFYSFLNFNETLQLIYEQIDIRNLVGYYIV